MRACIERKHFNYGQQWSWRCWQFLRADDADDKLFINWIGSLKIAATYTEVLYSKAASLPLLLITINVHVAFGLRFSLKQI